jgi:hypothetical protein
MTRPRLQRFLVRVRLVTLLAASVGTCDGQWRVIASEAPVGARRAEHQSDIASRLRDGDVDGAVNAFDAAVDRGAAADPAVLQQLATAVLRRESYARIELDASVEACLTVLRHAPDGCDSAVLPQSPSPLTKLRRMARAADVGPAQLSRELERVAVDFGPEDWNALAQVAGEFPPDIAVRLLTRALAADDEGVRFAAVDTLAAIEHPAALAALRRVAARPSGAGTTIAVAALAGAGDADSTAILLERLPDLHGQDLVAAGAALARQGLPAGREALRTALRMPEELLRLQAAAALVRAGDPEGHAVLDSALTDGNPWVRLRALELRVGLGLPATPAVWRQLVDPMPWVRVRAAQALVDAARSPLPQPGATAPANPRL